MEAIKDSLQRFGQAEPLVVQARSRRVIGGNGRLVAMKELGWTDCDIVELDIDDLQATALGIAAMDPRLRRVLEGTEVHRHPDDEIPSRVDALRRVRRHRLRM